MYEWFLREIIIYLRFFLLQILTNTYKSSQKFEIGIVLILYTFVGSHRII